MKIVFSQLEGKVGYSVLFLGKEVAGCYSGHLHECLAYLESVKTPGLSDPVEAEYKNIKQENKELIEKWMKKLE